jgi:hypothetical protein
MLDQNTLDRERADLEAYRLLRSVSLSEKERMNYLMTEKAIIQNMQEAAKRLLENCSHLRQANYEIALAQFRASKK